MLLYVVRVCFLRLNYNIRNNRKCSKIDDINKYDIHIFVSEVI